MDEVEDETAEVESEETETQTTPEEKASEESSDKMTFPEYLRSQGIIDK